MNFVKRRARGLAVPGSTMTLWLAFMAGGGLAALLIAALQYADAAMSRTSARAEPIAAGPTPDRPTMPRVEFAPTFSAAAESLRAGRHAEAYGRFVVLADEGDVDAARIALLLHRFGPDVFGSAWDASVEQVVEWTRWSEAATAKELAQLRGMAGAKSAANPSRSQ